MPTGRPITPAELSKALARVPRFALAHLPTPLEPLRAVSEKLGGPTIWMKRDDCTGLAGGGNKTRHAEYLIGNALAQGADIFVWGAGVQSNNCRQTAAACAKAGLDCHLILSRANSSGPIDVQGNLLLDHLLGASIEFVDAEIGPELDSVIATRANELRMLGRRPFEWNRHLVKPLATIGYVPCVLELVEQCRTNGIEPSAIYVCSAGSTGAGVALAAAALGLKCPVRSIAPLYWPWDTASDMADLANVAAQMLGLPHRLSPEDINVSEDYIEPGYGQASDECLAAIELIARHEAILLDPIYTGKAMAALIEHIEEGMTQPDEHVIFIHTGGTPALFAMNEMLADRVVRRANPM